MSKVIKQGGIPLKNLSYRQKLSFLFFPVSIIYMELIFKFLTTPNFFNLGLTFVPLYSVAAGFLFSAVCSCFSEKVNNLLARCFSFALSLIYATQVVYYWCFSKYLILYSVGVGGADQIIEEGIVDKTLITIKECIIPVLLLFLPAILSLFFVGKKRGVSFAKISVKARFGGFIGFIATHVLTTLLAILVPVTSEIYFAAFDPNLSAAYFGLLNTELQDIKYNVLGGEHPSDIEIDASSDIPTITPPTEQVKTTWQMDIDFDKLMQGETDEEVSSSLMLTISLT